MTYDPDDDELIVTGELRTAYPDRNQEDADWTKQRTWDLPPYKSPDFMRAFPDLDKFRTLPVYNAAVAAGLIVDDEWAADHFEES